MRCSSCGFADSRVVDSRPSEEGSSIRRRRECSSCGRRFTTFERVEAVVRVRKRSGAEEPFDRGKIAEGILRACKNRPIERERIEAVSVAIEDQVAARGSREVTSEEVGLLVLERLRELDDVAYVRFSSVYHGFAALADFERVVGRLQKKTPPKAASEPPVPMQQLVIS